MTPSHSNPPRVSAIIPARNEEAVLAACVESLARQAEIREILVVNDQSTDRTAEIARDLAQKYAHVRVLETTPLPAGWVGKNHAVWVGAQEATGEWLLFTDADAVHQPDSVSRALNIAAESGARMVSFSPEQVMDSWYEKALIPFVYGRLGERFSFEEINDPGNPAAAANGQFVLIERGAYEAAGGHAGVSGDVLEDVALARRVKAVGYRIWFGSGHGVVRVRMYRSFAGMWEGWKKNLFQLEGGRAPEVYRQLFAELVFLSGPLALIFLAYWKWRSWGAMVAIGLFFFLVTHAMHLQALRRNRFPGRLALYLIPGSVLYTAALWASYRSHRKGTIEWKGRVYPAAAPGHRIKE
ncbi:MAG TPA: glycosyltransferase family 2 protein [Candidatus Acidoferrum sp.]